MMLASILCAALLVAATLCAQTGDIGAPPGKLVDIGGRKLHVLCAGRGSPTVILEAGAGAFAIDWSLVQPEVARTNRVCSYDRAGSGWSDPRKGVTTPNAIVLDLHAALEVAGEKPPYLMVGASAGGIYVRLYQIRYPREVAGMVLVDPSHEDRLFTMFEGKGVAIASLTAEQLRSTISPKPVSIPPRPAQTGAPFDRLGHDLYAQRIQLETRVIAAVPGPVSPEVVAESAEGERAALAELHSTAQDRPLGDRPLVVLTRGVESSQDLKDAHASLMRLSTNSRHRVIAGSGHEIHLFDPPAVILAIRDVVEAVGNGSRLPAR